MPCLCLKFFGFCVEYEFEIPIFFEKKNILLFGYFASAFKCDLFGGKIYGIRLGNVKYNSGKC